MRRDLRPSQTKATRWKEVSRGASDVCGASIHDVCKKSGFVDPLPPPCHVQKSADFVPFICFLAPSPLDCGRGRHVWKPPKQTLSSTSWPPLRHAYRQSVDYFLRLVDWWSDYSMLWLADQTIVPSSCQWTCFVWCNHDSFAPIPDSEFLAWVLALDSIHKMKAKIRIQQPTESNLNLKPFFKPPAPGGDIHYGVLKPPSQITWHGADAILFCYM